MGIPLPQWLKKNSDILFNTGSLVATMLVTSVLGFAYWLVAARFYSPDSVGLASAATSAMMLLSTFFLLGQGTVLLTEIPRNKGLEGPIISTSLLLVSIATLVASIVFAVLAPYISPQLGSLGATPQNVLLFAVGACLASITVILDQAVIALLQGGIQLWRNTLFAVTKLILLVIVAQFLGQTTGMSIYTTWAIGNAFSLLPIVIFLIRKKKCSLKYYIPQKKMLRSLGLASIQHHSLNLILQAPAQILPLLVTVMLSAKMNASFYTAYMIANFVFSLSFSLTTVLHATNAAQVTTLTQKTRLTVGLSFLSSLCIGAVLIVGAEPILSIFGKTYADNAAESLRILMVACIPLIIKNHFISLCRIKDRVAQAIIPITLGSLLELGLAAYGAHINGLTGLCLGWVLAMMIEALFMVPSVATVLLGRNLYNPYLDEVASSDTIMLPALNQQTGAIQLVTLGNMMTLAELDTIQLPAIQQYRASLKLGAIGRDNNLLRLPSKVPAARQQQTPEPNKESIGNKPQNTLLRWASNGNKPQNTLLRWAAKANGFTDQTSSDQSEKSIADYPTAYVRKSDIDKERAAYLALHASKDIADANTAHMAVPERPQSARIEDMQTVSLSVSSIRTLAAKQSSQATITNRSDVDKPTEKIRRLEEQDDLELARQPSKLDIIIDLLLYFVPIGAFLIWYLSLQDINVRQMNDLGLISVFTPSMIGALAVITASFCLVIRRPRGHYPALILYFGLLILMLYGVNTLIEEMPRFAVVYRHAGYTEYIMRTGTVDPTLDAYFSWPGFFSLNAFITSIAGYSNILNYAMWSPVFYNAFYFGPLYMLFTSFTKNKRIVYLAIWFFYLTNWIGQDYFSPQGLNFFLYLVIIAILVKWFKTSEPGLIPFQPKPLGPRLRKIPLLARIYPWLTAPDPLTTSLQPRQRRALITCIIVIFAFVVFSHQLTPFFIILSVSALVLFHRCRHRWLPLLMIAMTATWILLMTQAFLVGHMSDVVGGFHLFNSFSQNVTSRVAGNPQHTFIARIRIYMSVLVWGLAVISGFIRWRRGYRDATIVLLALTPFPFFIIQPYGGEMLLRSYLFSLPSMVFFIAAFFYSVPLLKKGHWRVVGSVCLCLILLGGFFYTRYGNENMDYMTNDEVAGVEYLYSIAPAHSLLLGGWDGAPWHFKDYEKYTLVSLSESHLFKAASTEDVNAIVQYLQAHQQKGGNVYMLFTRSQKMTFNSMSGLPPGSLDQIEEKIAASGDFNLVYQNPDAQIYQFIAPGEATP
jgi:O-antigen/teichoic acid export membrane protein